MTTPKLKPDPMSYPPRGMSRIEAARYLGIGPNLFDEMVKDRRMPKPRELNGRVVWDRIEIDIHFSNLPHRGEGNAIDNANRRAAEAATKTQI